MAEALLLLRRYWYLIVIAALVFVLLYMRGDMTSLESAKEKAETKAATLQAVNDTNAKVIEGFTAQRIANDAIIKQLSEAKSANVVRETNTRTIIEEAKRNDPAASSWVNTPVPDSLRRAINAPGD